MAYIDFTIHKVRHLINTDEIILITFDKTTDNSYYIPVIEIFFKQIEKPLILTSANVEYLSELHRFITAMTTIKSAPLHFVTDLKETNDASTNS